MFLLDTNSIIYYLAGQPRLVLFIEKYKEAPFFLPTVVIVEFLSYPLLDKNTLVLFEKFLNDVIIVNLDLELAKFAGKLRKRYRLKTIDAIVAASAVTTGASLLTYNVKDFQRVKELSIISP